MIEYLAAEGGIALLEVNPGLSIWTGVTFLLVLLLLHKFGWKKITEALDARAQKVHDNIDRAEQLKKEAEEKLEEYMTKLNGLRQESQELLAEARKDSEVMRNEILESARNEADEIRARARREVDLAIDAALEKIHSEAAGLSIEIASKILGSALKPEDHSRLIQETIDSVKSARG